MTKTKSYTHRHTDRADSEVQLSRSWKWLLVVAYNLGISSFRHILIAGETLSTVSSALEQTSMGEVGVGDFVEAFTQS